MKLTASRAALAFRCQWWMRDEAPHLETSPGPWAEEGSLLHAMIEAHLKGTDPMAPVDAFSLNDDAVARVKRKYAAWHAWYLLQPEHPWKVEQALAFDPKTGRARELLTDHHRDYSRAEPGEVAMTADVLGVGQDEDGSYAVCLDWKSGQDSVYAPAQLGLLGLAWARVLGVSRAFGRAVYIGEEGVHEKSVWMTEMDMDILQHELVRILETPDPDPQPGPHCSEMWCPARHQCPATQASIAVVAGLSAGDIEQLALDKIQTPLQAGLAHLRLKVVTDAVDAVKKRIREVVEASGSAPTRPGKELRLFRDTYESFARSRLPPESAEATLQELRDLGALTFQERVVLREVKVK